MTIPNRAASLFPLVVFLVTLGLWLYGMSISLRERFYLSEFMLFTIPTSFGLGLFGGAWIVSRGEEGKQ